MTFTLSDLIEKVGAAQRDGVQGEYVGGEVASIRPATPEEILRLFPGEKLAKDGSVAYLPVKMCHSIPSRNKRGRGFHPKVMARSCETARDSLVNYEHQIIHNGTGAEEDLILGHIKAACFDPENILGREAANDRAFPLVGIPMYALVALFLRHSLVPGMIKEHLSNKPWATSMECDHTWKEAAFFYENEMIPLVDAPGGMLECVEKGKVHPYKDRDLTVCLGGEHGSVKYWGLGMTKKPADTDADVMSILTTSPMELASVDGASRKKIFLPLRLQKFSACSHDMELAHEAVDTKMKELASVEVLGKTDPAEDGHVHELLTDGTILPAQNHLHNVANYSLVKATTPRFTGRTDTHYYYPPSLLDASGVVQRVGEAVVHLHTFDIALRGKKAADPESASLLEADLEVLGPEVSMKLSDFLVKLDKVDSLVQKLSSGNSGEKGASPEIASALAEVTALRKELSQGALQETIKEEVQKEIASQVTAGELVPKAKVEEIKTAAVTAAVTEETKKFELATKQAEIKAKRLEAVNALGIDLESKPYQDEDKDLTVKARLDAIALDDAGDKEFKLEFRFLKTLNDAAIAAENAANAAKTAEEKEAEKVALKKVEDDAESARKAALATPALASTGDVKRKRIIGAPSKPAETSTREVAAETDEVAEVKKDLAGKKMGRFAFSK